MNKELEAQWYSEFKTLWIYFENEHGHIRSPSNRFSWKAYLAACKKRNEESESMNRFLYLQLQEKYDELGKAHVKVMEELISLRAQLKEKDEVLVIYANGFHVDGSKARTVLEKYKENK